MNKLPWHINGKLHVKGQSKFIGEELKPAGLLYAKLLFSPVAHAKLIRLDVSQAQALAGVTAVITARDIPGINQIGHVIKDEPLFPEDRIMYVGQPLAMVLSPYPRVAQKALKLISLEYQELNPILDVAAADALQEWYVPERKIENGDVETALQAAPFTFSGTVESAGQEHFYMETQRCVAIPGEDDTLVLYSATQSTMEVQEVVSHLLGIPAHKIVLDVRRLGGAFGGKERAGTIWGCLSALGAYVTKLPVELILDRTEDMQATGKRHPFLSNYRVGFDETGKITAYDITLLANGGAYSDLSVAILERAMFHADNAYYIPNIRIRGRACRTNLPPNTAYRGFGAPQGIFVIENIIEQIARQLQTDAVEIRKRNLYQDGDVAPYGQPLQEVNIQPLIDRLIDISHYDLLKQQVSAFNAEYQDKKQGIGMVPVKFGISFTTALLNQGSALIWVYIDGTVSVTTGGIEMGQEVNTKIALIVADVLGISLAKIRVESSNSQRVGNASPTAASTGSDINGNAARIAAEQIKTRLVSLASELFTTSSGKVISPEDVVLLDDKALYHAQPEQNITFPELIQQAYVNRIALGAHGYYATPEVHFDRATGKGHPFAYYVWGAALIRAEIDIYTGECRMLDTYIVHETAHSLHPEIDRGQITGAFVQALGWCTMEALPHDSKGRFLALSPSTYKIPGIRDLPEHFHVEMVQTPCSQASVKGSKAVGEPPFVYGEAVWFALRNAIQAAVGDSQPVLLAFPATPEAILESLSLSHQDNPVDTLHSSKSSDYQEYKSSK